MPGCSFEMNGFTNFQTLGNTLALVLKSNGFSMKFPAASTIAPTDSVFTFEVTADTDPLASTQPWRIHIDCSDNVTYDDPGTLRVFVATVLQLPDDGSVAWEYPGGSVTNPGSGNPGDPGYVAPFTVSGLAPRKSGELTCGFYDLNNAVGDNMIAIPFASKHFSIAEIPTNQYGTPAGTPNSTTNANIQGPEVLDTSFDYKGRTKESHPYSFRLSISDHGIALFVWEEGQDLWGNKFSWMVAQRPVDSSTGVPLVVKDANSRCPVFCVYSIGGGEPDTTVQKLAIENFSSADSPYDHTLFSKAAKIYRFTVREIDVNRPTVPVLASIDTPDNRAVINAKQQVSIAEGNAYVLSFMRGFNTARFSYSEDIDMVTYTSADVISSCTEVTVSPYKTVGNVPIPLKYRAMQSNLGNNNGMRMLILIDGNGVSGNCGI